MYSEFDNLKKSEIFKILAIVGLSDGTIKKQKNYIRLVTSNKSKCLHDFFRYLCNKVTSRPPRTCVTHFKSGFSGKIEDHIQTTLTSEKVILRLFKFIPNYKTTKGKLTKEDFLNGPQPNLRFLYNSSKRLKLLAFRLWFDFDGCLIPSFKLKRKTEKKSKYIYNYYQVQFEAELRIAETNPNLVEDLIRLCSSIGFNAIKKYKKKNWSGLDGISVTRLLEVKEFCKFGPITNVMVSDKSPRFSGVRKKNICEAVFKILEDPNIKKSKYFKDKFEALEYKNKMDKLLLNLIKPHQENYC